jgi:hypothetical protein
MQQDRVVSLDPDIHSSMGISSLTLTSSCYIRHEERKGKELSLMHDRALRGVEQKKRSNRLLLSFTTESRYFILFSKNASGTTQFHHTSDQNTLKDITNLFQQEQLLSKHAAVFPWNGEETQSYTQSYTLWDIALAHVFDYTGS